MSATLHLGDSRALLKTIAAQSIDSIVTDPPYELGFMGKKWDSTGVAYLPTFWAEALRVLKPGGYLLAFGGTRTYHRLACAIEDAGFEIRDQIGWAFGQGFPKSHNLNGEHEGWGSALKPAWEPVCMARKPLQKGLTIEANVAAWGTGAINVDACRVPITPGVDDSQIRTMNRSGGVSGDGWGMHANGGASAVVLRESGRWPANIAHDGSDEVLAAFPQAPGQLADAKIDPEGRKTQGVYGAMSRGHGNGAGAKRADRGSAARFFYCAKASRADREAGLREAVTDDGRNTPIDNPYLRGETKRLNSHPTVKPTELMRWLCRMVTPKRGLVLDPFMGSGSTGRAAVLEGFNFVGIEAEAEYMAIAKARIADVDCI